MTLDGREQEIKEAIRRASGSVVYSWPDVVEKEDLEQELWVWLMESPSAQRKLTSIPRDERHKILVRQGHLIASKISDHNKVFAGDVVYSVEEVKEALLGRNLGHDIVDDLADAMEILRDKNNGHAAAIRSRYGDREFPKEPAARMVLSRAIVSLTTEMNRVLRNKFAEHTDGPGTRQVLSNAEAEYRQATAND